MENSKKQIVIFTQSKFSFRFLLQCPSVGDHFTNNFLSSLTSKYVWIGGYKDESQGWSWSDGTRWRYSSWSDGQPNNGEGNQQYKYIVSICGFADPFNARNLYLNFDFVTDCQLLST